jgi:F-type H+-transporting ATPase subunit epsilon
MSGRTLSLEIVTPDGCAVVEEAVDAVVFHRREPRFDVGSEIAIFPLHAPLLARLAVAPMRYRKGAGTVDLAVAGGFVEVSADRVLVLTPRCERIAPGTPGPRAAAGVLCRTWARAMAGFRAEMVGAGRLVPLPGRAGRADEPAPVR